MVRLTLILLIVLLLELSSFSQVLDRAPSGRQNYLAVTGGSRPMKIDSISSLDILIAKLSEDWELVETGKMYWIGYTEDMFSIAARGDKAIEPLVKVLQNPKNDNAKYGALLSLHLIGIDRKIVGRFTEKFVNPKARSALLELLHDTTLQREIMRLLIRNPWTSDISHIIELIEHSSFDCWALINGLARYQINNFPIDQDLPEGIKNISIRLKNDDRPISEANFNFDPQILEALNAIKQLNRQNIFIEDTLFKSKLTGDVGIRPDTILTIRGFFDQLNFNDYLGLGSRIQYYVEDEKLYICSPETAKRRVVTWWNSLTPDQKATYRKDH